MIRVVRVEITTTAGWAIRGGVDHQLITVAANGSSFLEVTDAMRRPQFNEGEAWEILTSIMVSSAQIATWRYI